MSQPPFPPQHPPAGGPGYPQATYPSATSSISGGYGSGPGTSLPAPPPRGSRRTGLWVALGCLVLLVGGLVLGGGGLALWLLGREEPTTTTSAPANDPEEEPAAPVDQDSISVTVVETGSFDSLEIDGETHYPATDGFVGVSLDLTNHNASDIGMDNDNFLMVAADGTTYPIYYGSYSTSGPWIAPGETAAADLYADVPDEVTIVAVTYADDVATGGEPAEIPIG